MSSEAFSSAAHLGANHRKASILYSSSSVSLQRSRSGRCARAWRDKVPWHIVFHTLPLFFCAQPTKPTSNEQKLKLYALYKQAVEGDCEGERPGIFAGIQARSKHDAWKAQEGKEDMHARDEYVEEARLQMSEHS